MILCFTQSTRIAAVILFLVLAVAGGWLFLQTADLFHQLVIVGAFSVALILCGYVFWINLRIDRLRLQKG